MKDIVRFFTIAIFIGALFCTGCSCSCNTTPSDGVPAVTVPNTIPPAGNSPTEAPTGGDNPGTF